MARGKAAWCLNSPTVCEYGKDFTFATKHIIMTQAAGIKYIRDAKGHISSVRINIDRYGENEAFQDFLDGAEAESRKGEETFSLEEFRALTIKRFGKDV
ncbi:hypothetical protein Barb7_01707 [Bacteroidales bacterium Barb7]|nr:hypothetical protein Barb7_01707 [Bacteroidales bacterium Barb7]